MALHFQLTEHQQQELLSRERSSFLGHCNEFGFDPEAHESRLYEYFQAHFKNIFKQAAKRGASKTVIDGHIRKLSSLHDYWAFLRWSTEEKRRQLVTEIMKASHVLPINYEYLSQLASSMGIEPPTCDESERLRAMLLQVPILNLFAMEFNAFVSHKSIIDGIPSICFYALLPGSLEILVNVFLSVLAVPRPDHSFERPRPSRIVEAAKTPEFMLSFIAVLQSLLGKAAIVEAHRSYYFSILHPQCVLELGEVMYASSYYVGFHEFGHFMMGHLERSPGMDLEREADSFAARVMLCTAENPCVATWRALGTSILFSALEIIEKIRGQSATTHPEAAARLLELNSDEWPVDLAEVLTMIRLLWKEGFNELKKHRKREC